MKNVPKSFLPLPLWLYCVGWVFLVYLFISILRFQAEASNNLLVSGMYFINFGVHEASHFAAMVLPQILTAAAGSIGELSFTVLLLVAAIKAKSYFAACFAGLWVMLGCMSMGRYMLDARSQMLPLIGPSETVRHDWNFVFSELGWLELDGIIGGTVQGMSICIGAISIGAAMYLIYLKFTQSSVLE